MFDSDECRTIPGFSAYRVSGDGRVWRVVRAKFGRAVPYEVCGWRSARGYVHIHLVDDGGRGGLHLRHRVVALAFHGSAPSSAHVVAHGNGRPGDDRPDNLRWATQLENQRQMRDHGAAMIGTRATGAKLTDAIVLEMRAAYTGRRGEQRRMAARLGISNASVCQILARKSWRHVP